MAGTSYFATLVLHAFILLAIVGVDGCKFPGAPAHSTVVFSDETLGPGTVATYACERGFELLGPGRRVCEPDGRWLPDGIPFCVLNVAAGKAPMQASTEGNGIPQKAIDGSTSSFFSADTCTLTKPERVPWWYVNLLEPYMVQLVRLDFGKPCCGANKPATIVVRVGNNRPDLGTNPICNRFTGFIEEGQPLFLPCNPPMPGAFVSVHLEVPTPTQLSICEAFVYTDQALPIERCPQFRDQPPGSTATYNGKCYVFYSRTPATFRSALAACRSRGGTLVDESNPALQGFISWELWRRHRSDTNSQYWMGAVRDPQERNNWKWINGEDVTVSFWNVPGGDEDCARYDGSKGWLWSDTDCNAQLNYICQHQPKACGRPEQPPNSTMNAPGFDVGATVKYSCDEGHLLVGPAARTCLDTGFYNEFPPVCKHIQCGFPADIPSGRYVLLNDSVGYLSNVVYKCDEGYEMIGRAQLTCDIDERWNGPPPRCEPIECENPIPVKNGVFTSNSNGSMTFGAVVKYECDAGYRLVGAAELHCLPNGQYDAATPTCRQDAPTTASIVPSPPRSSSARPTTRGRPRPAKPSPTTVRALTETDILNRIKQKQQPTSTRGSSSTTPPSPPPHIIVAGHPQENEIGESSVNVRHSEAPNVNVPLSVDGVERRQPFSARLNLGAIIALAAFGGFVFLAAIITTIVILVRRNQSAKHYRHRASPDCNTVASFDSSSSESRNGLNRYYRQAWENLHESAGSKAGLKAAAAAAAAAAANGHHHQQQLKRKETMDTERHREASELVVTDVARAPDKKRHHHHHHHHKGEAPLPPHNWQARQHQHKRY